MLIYYIKISILQIDFDELPTHQSKKNNKQKKINKMENENDTTKQQQPRRCY